MKRSLPVGLGLSETKITSHGFDSTKEGVVEAGPFPGKGNWFFVCISQFKIFRHIFLWLEIQCSVAALNILCKYTHWDVH